MTVHFECEDFGRPLFHAILLWVNNQCHYYLPASILVKLMLFITASVCLSVCAKTESLLIRCCNLAAVCIMVNARGD